MRQPFSSSMLQSFRFLRRGGNLWVRVLSALVLLPVVLSATYYDGWVFRLLIGAGALLAVREWARMIAPGLPVGAPRMLSYGALCFVMGADAMFGWRISLSVSLLSSVVFLIGLRWVAFRDRVLLALGIPYLALCGVGLVWLRERSNIGLELVLFLFCVVWATDIGAYAVGRMIGGPRLAPDISPRKTWAGLWGGMVSGALTAGAFAWIADAKQPLIALAVGAALAIIEQIGDLFESAVKRRYKVKDSGHLIPGHGGLLDRIDGLIAATPAFALFHATLGPWW
ncbi:phosphatidate cytidylyltransferase [Azospirillaceae bacterium]